MIDLSIIIPSYNTAELTKKTITSLIDSLEGEGKKKKITYEIIVVDNASQDGSVEMLKTQKIKQIFLKKNIGYSKANNRGIKEAKGRYILFLNSDIVVDNVVFSKLITYLDTKKDIGGLTVKVTLEDGTLDEACHRGFPTPWRAFCYYSGLEKMSRGLPVLPYLFGGYHLLQYDLTTTHEIDSPSGAFFLARSDVIKKIGGFDEVFFMYGEDLDLAFRIFEQGYKIMYYPHHSVIHLKYKSGLQTSHAKTKTEIKYHFYDAMRIFYKKHYEHAHPGLLNRVVYFIIEHKKKKV